MADIRINALATTATTPASDDYLALDGTAQGTRKILATNIANNVTDVILGTSGPSVKSTLSARAPRQGLVFDGTTGAEISGPTLGSGDWTFSGWVYCKALGGSILGGANNSLRVSLRTSGAVFYGLQGGANSADTSTTLPVDKWSHLVITKSGTSGTVYLNGISIQTSTDNRNYSVAQSLVGSTSFASGDPFNGVIVPSIYNRALSASEVVALYEAGAPAGADYVNGGTTAPTGATFLNYQYDTFTGASATGFTAAETGGQNCVAYSNYTSGVYAVGTKIKVTFSATLTSGATPTVYLANLAGTPVATSATVVAGSNSQTFTLTTATTVAQHLQLVFSTSGNTSYAISSVVVQPLGLLLAPDAAQAGGGLTWYDTSGNAANITLPASGVSWNVPSSRVLGGNWTTSGNLTVSGTGTSTFAGSISVGSATGSGGQNAITFPKIGGGSYANHFYLYNGNTDNPSTPGFSLYDVTNSAWRWTTTNSGNFLIGTTTDSANGKLQLATHTTSAGGIGFGTDTSLYRSAAYTLKLDGGNNVTSFRVLGSGSCEALMAVASASSVLFGSTTAGASTVLCSGNGTTALTLDASQNATFAGTVYINKTTPTLELRESGVAQAQFYTFGGALTIQTNTAKSISLATNGTTALTLDSSQRCILSGALRLANTYVATPQVSTGYVTIQDSTGTTYKVLVAT